MKQQAIIYTDGGSRGNPGPAGIGALLLQQGQVVSTLSKYLGIATNNIAEYTALIVALEKGLELGFTDVEVRTDSELVVRQMTGHYRVKHSGLIPLFNKARKLAAQFASFKIVHVRREENKQADRLANQAMDTKADQLIADGCHSDSFY
ncbi:MAG: ribonuclease HI family protein [Candidatus Melainabacteria bacterium]|nr:ribonuclease HI family protein [Candidatus Melainabacteria bacterium]